MKKYRIKKSKKLIAQLKPYFKELQELERDFHGNVYNLEKKMAKETGIKDIEFFALDNSYVGIGNTSREMQLIHNRELEE